MDWGNVPDWISGLGGLFSVVFVAWTAVTERMRRISAENVASQVQHFHRSEIAQAAISQLTSLADTIRLAPEREISSRLVIGGVRDPAEVALKTCEAIGVLRALPQVEPSLHIALLAAEQACSIGDIDGGTVLTQIHAVSAARARIQSAKEQLEKLL